MFIVNSYSWAVVLCTITMLCWGSWANTQKLASKTWSFQLFYWDYSSNISKITVYPVPASDQIIVSGLSEKTYDFLIMDVVGKTVKKIKSSGMETRINITDLHPGYYFIRVENRTLRFMKQ